MRVVPIAQVDAFTTSLFGGNPAGVVLDASHLSEIEMQQIAQEFNLSETAFVLPSKSHNFKLRYFTPTKEVKFCGHATVGALHALAKTHRYNMQPQGEYHFKVETGAGVIPMTVNYKSTNEIQILFDSPKIDLVATSYSHQDIAAALGIGINILDQTKPIMREKTNDFIFLTVKNLNSLGKVQYDHETAKKFAEKEQVIVFCLLTPETFNSQNRVHVRVFGPAIGLKEDPVTGAIQGGLAAYLLENQLVPSNTSLIGSEQGNFVNRPGQLKVVVKKQGKHYQAIIHATAVSVFESQIVLP